MAASRELIVDTSADLFIRQNRSHEDVAVAFKTSDSCYRFYGVYDGHGHPNNMKENHVAYVLANGYKNLSPLHQYLYDMILASSNKSETPLREWCLFDIKEVIAKAFIMYDKAMLSLGCVAGSCATVVVIIKFKAGSYVHVCNLGDSKTCIWNDDGQILLETEDHDTFNAQEIIRINKAGGYIQNDRVLGSLAVSRAFGDWGYKRTASSLNYEGVKGFVSTQPDIYSLYLEDKGIKNRIMLTSDGPYENGTTVNYLLMLYNVLSSMSSNIAEKLANRTSHGTTDDITIMFVDL